MSTDMSTGASSTDAAREAYVVRAQYTLNVDDDCDPTAQAVPLDASLHLRPRHPITLTVHGDQQRVVLKFGNPVGPGLHLFLPADLVDRLIQLLTVAALDLAGMPVMLPPTE